MARIIERAFELASSGECLTLQQLGMTLRNEGYDGVTEHLQGAAIRKQLNSLIAEARRSGMHEVQSPETGE